MRRVLPVLITLLALPFALAGLVLAAGAVASVAISQRVGAAFPPAGPFVDVEGGRLATIQAGPAAGVPVVLLHGASGNASDPMEGVGRLLADKGFRVIAFDRPGFGWSDRLDGANAALPAVQAGAVAQGLERMGIGPAIVLGHSWSGALALALALDHPERVSGLVLAAPVALPFRQREGTLPWYWRLALKPPAAWLLSRTIGPPLALLFLDKAARNVFLPQAEAPGYLEKARAALVVRPHSLLANLQDLIGLPAALAAQSPRYGTLKVPTVVVSGEADPVVTNALQAAPLARAIPGARLVLLPGIGHMLHYVAADALAEEVGRLAGTVAAGRADAAAAR